MLHKPITSPDLVRGIAAWLRASARATDKVELSPKTATMIAELLEASVGAPEQQQEAA